MAEFDGFSLASTLLSFNARVRTVPQNDVVLFDDGSQRRLMSTHCFVLVCGRHGIINRFPTTMKRTASFLRQLQALFACLLASLLISCATKELERCPPGTPGIILSQPVECTHKDGRFTLPAGHYQAEAQSPKGIYYAAPERLKTDGIIRAGQERGGLFIAREGWQWAWTGHPGWEAEQSATTITGKRGIIMPTHYKFEPWVRYQVAKQQRSLNADKSAPIKKR